MTDLSLKLSQCKRVLVIRYRFIGDTILSVPFLRNLRSFLPEAKIDMLVGPQSGEVLEGCPYVDQFITFDTTRFHKYDSGQGKRRSFWHYAAQLRAQHYDLVFVLKRSWSSAALALLTGARHRIGYATEGRKLLLSRSVTWNNKIHEVESTLDVLRAADIPVSDKHLEAWVSAQEKESIALLVPELKTPKKRILIHAAAAHPDKMYPLDKWEQVISSVAQKTDSLFFFTGAQQDSDLYEQLGKASGTQFINLAGRLTLRQSMALYEQMDVCLCVDSGPAHLSAAVGTPTVTLFGPSDPQRWRPLGDGNITLYDDSLSCRPCNYRKTCSNRECLTDFSAQKIVQACFEVLNANDGITNPLTSSSSL